VNNVYRSLMDTSTPYYQLGGEGSAQWLKALIKDRLGNHSLVYMKRRSRRGSGSSAIARFRWADKMPIRT
jgi:hypothetical protein